jgi:hypothetical protein
MSAPSNNDPLTIQQVLYYEVSSSWWAGWISINWLQDLACHYFLWKVRRKYARYFRALTYYRRRELQSAFQEQKQ